jgi:LysM repeat protein
MPDYKPNQFVRAFAVLALIAALVVIVVIVATSNGGNSDGNNGNSHKSHVSKVGRRAVHRGVWVVHAGDTLGLIALKTGIAVTTLQQLNPNIDPQTLIEGQRIALR